jgi:hypothetical protein
LQISAPAFGLRSPSRAIGPYISELRSEYDDLKFGFSVSALLSQEASGTLFGSTLFGTLFAGVHELVSIYFDVVIPD